MEVVDVMKEELERLKGKVAQWREKYNAELDKHACRVCRQAPIDWIYLPCRHIGVCTDCKDRLPDQHKCPFCNVVSNDTPLRKILLQVDVVTIGDGLNND